LNHPTWLHPAITEYNTLLYKMLKDTKPYLGRLNSKIHAIEA
jgi:hypothetical protein